MRSSWLRKLTSTDFESKSISEMRTIGVHTAIAVENTMVIKIAFTNIPQSNLYSLIAITQVLQKQIPFLVIVEE